jgi:hypothetical protein
VQLGQPSRQCFFEAKHTNTQEVFKIAEEAEKLTAAMKGRRQRQGQATTIEVEHDGVDILQIESSAFESDCIVVAADLNSKIQRQAPRLPRCLSKPGFPLGGGKSG